MLPFSVLNEKQAVNSWLLAVYNLTAGYGPAAIRIDQLQTRPKALRR